MQLSTRLEAATSRSVRNTAYSNGSIRVCLVGTCSLNCAVSLLSSSVDQKVKIVAEAKIPKAADASKHKAGGGNVEIRQSHS